MSAPTVPPPVRAPEKPGRIAEVRELSRTTPGVLVLFSLAIVVASVLVGVLTAISVQGRAQALDNLTARSGPLSDAAQELYSSLSDADATANSAFLSGGLEDPATRTRYEQDIARAEHSLALAIAARDPADLADQNSPLAVLSSQLSVYTGLVETARANNRQGFPVGAAYQREASTVMEDLLLAAGELYRTEALGVDADQDQAAAWPVVELVLGIAALVLLFFAQRFVRRRSRRRINVGLAVATGALLVSVLWVLAATIGVLANVNASRENGSTQTKVLAEARLNALSARGDETLTLVARGSGAQYDERYDTTRAILADTQLVGAATLATDDTVRRHVRDAIEQERNWHETHERIRTADEDGSYEQAVQLAIGPGADGAAASFDAVDRSLREAIASTTATFEREVAQARNALTGTVIGVILLALVMAGAAVTGLWQRLKEYR